MPPEIKASPVLRELWKMVYKKKMNLIILVNGLPRTGKSELCLALAYFLDRGSVEAGFPYRFDVENIRWKYGEFLSLVKNKNEIGTCLIWEEAGTIEGTNARKFFSENNISASSLFQTLGYKRQIAFINLPCKIMLDKHVRQLVHAIIDTTEVNTTKGRCIAKFYWSKYNPVKDIQYRNLPQYFDESGILKKVNTIAVGRAPKALREAYIKRERVFKDELQARLEKMGQKAGKDSVEERDEKIREACKKIEGRLSRYWDPKRKILRTGLIVLDCQVSRNQAYIIKDILQPKILAGEIQP